MTLRGDAKVTYWFVCGALVASVSGAGCASSKAASAPQPSTPAAPSASAPAPVQAPPDTPVSKDDAPEPDATDDEPIPKDCNFRVKGFCFKTDEEACAAAGCDQAHCVIMESHPARVKCKP